MLTQNMFVPNILWSKKPYVTATVHSMNYNIPCDDLYSIYCQLRCIFLFMHYVPPLLVRYRTIFFV
jgi:hypothetical protein